MEYCEQNRIDRIQAFNKSTKERFFYKNSDLSYQREYRLEIAHEISKDHYIRIGKLENTTIVNAETLQNFMFSIGYESHQLDEK